MSVNHSRGAERLQRNAPTEEPAIEPAPEIIHCKDCKHWDRRWSQANHAECMQATKFRSGTNPLLTTDLQTCSQAQPRVPRAGVN